MKALVDSMVRIPRQLLKETEIVAIKKELTIIPRDFGGVFTKEPPLPIESYTLDSSTLSVPIQWGVSFCHRKGIPLLSQLQEGVAIHTFPRRPDPNHIKAPKGQEKFFADVIAACEQSCVVLGCSPTGTGKTATGLNTLAHFGRAGLIIVHSKEIARQWREDEIPLHLGIPSSMVGVVEEDQCIYEGKPIVVAVIHNIILKTFDQSFYDQFGFIIWDEGHKLGAPAFNSSVRYFAAKKKLVLTATPSRKDGCMPLITNYFGMPRATAESTPMTTMVKVVTYQHKRNYPSQMNRAVLINAVTSLVDRNEQMTELIYAMWKAGRNFIGMSERIPQLQTIQEMLVNKGVPPIEIGLYTRSYTDDLNRAKNHTADELAFYREHAKIFLSTYAMTREAFNLPRLDAGMCLSPTSDGEQAIGRICRLLEGKSDPVWYVVKDVGNFTLLRSYQSFLKGVRPLKHIQIVGAV